MREIEFRAWSGHHMIHNIETSYELVDFILDHNTNQNYIVMQYTGIKDKNGKKIYEGDIVEYIGHKNRVVTWTPEGRYAGWYASRPILENNINDHLPIGEGNEYNTIEVIGNIYETPELLNKENNTLTKEE